MKKGDTVGRLTLVKKVVTDRGYPRWICVCECGRSVSVAQSNLSAGKVRHCGCLSKRRKPGEIRPGDRFGALRAIEKIYVTTKSGRKTPKWKCQCDCGRLTEVFPTNLRSGNTTSCGCKMKYGFEEAKYKGTAYAREVRRRWRDMMRRAKARHIDVEKSLRTFPGFWKALGRSYSPGARLTRVTRSLGYYSDNLYWRPAEDD